MLRTNRRENHVLPLNKCLDINVDIFRLLLKLVPLYLRPYIIHRLLNMVVS